MLCGAKLPFLLSLLFNLLSGNDNLSEERRTKKEKWREQKETTIFRWKLSFLFGGGRWIRTTEVIDSRFTVCPLWPLGNSPKYSFFAPTLCSVGRFNNIPYSRGNVKRIFKFFCFWCVGVTMMCDSGQPWKCGKPHSGLHTFPQHVY